MLVDSCPHGSASLGLLGKCALVGSGAWCAFPSPAGRIAQIRPILRSQGEGSVLTVLVLGNGGFGWAEGVDGDDTRQGAQAANKDQQVEELIAGEGAAG